MEGLEFETPGLEPIPQVKINILLRDINACSDVQEWTLLETGVISFVHPQRVFSNHSHSCSMREPRLAERPPDTQRKEAGGKQNKDTHAEAFGRDTSKS